MKYGNTWWGEQFLHSLTNIDYSNRLPRGRTYANNGYVKKIQIAGNKITAKVKGSTPRPYSITITVPEFSQKQKTAIIKTILTNPMLLSKLLNRELPVALDNLAKEKGIAIFPQTWEDFDMNCSCPDWAVPCKHLASVIYIISKEIDKNPFIVFQLHGLDISNELKQHGFETKKELEVPKATNLFLPSERTIAKTKPPEIAEPVTIDFSIIPPLQEQLFSLLASKPLFYTKDFCALMRKNYKASARSIKYLQLDDETEIQNVFELEKIEQAEVIFHNEVFYFDTVFYTHDDEKHFSKQKGFERLIRFIERIPNKYVSRLHSSIQALYYIYHFSLRLIETGAYIPQIVRLANGSYAVRWIPATLNEEVNTIAERLTNIAPYGLIKMYDDAPEPKTMPPKEQIITLTSLFLEHLFFAHASYPSFTYKNPDDKIHLLFFTRSSQTFDGLGEQEIPGSIYQWLNRFHIGQKEFVPVIKVEEAEENVFSVELLVENTQKQLDEPISFVDFLEKKAFAHAKTGVLQLLAGLVNDFSDMEDYISSGGEDDLIYDSDEFVEILIKILPVVKTSGIKILLPQSLKYLVRPKTTMQLSQKSDNDTAKSFLGLDEMLNFEWQVAIGDQNVSVKEFKKLVKGLSGIVKIKGQYILIDQAEINKLLENLTHEHNLTKEELLKVALTEEYQEAKIAISKQARNIIKNLLSADQIQPPPDLNATLRPYQERGYQWLYNNLQVGFGSILADDMGLGKTIQVITLLLTLKAENRLDKHKAIIVVPTTLISNWYKEIQQFAPSLKCNIYHGTHRKLELTDCDVMITSYGMIRSDIELVKKKKWAMLVIDEAQNIKNPTTEQTKAIKKIKTQTKIALSGTPVENRLSEYWSIFDFVNKGYLGSLKYFKKEFSTPIELYNNQQQLDKFKSITSPFILRRLKTDKKIINDLPEKIENNRYVSLTKEQTAIYQNVLNELMPQIQETQGEENEQIKRAGLVFKMMTALKQVCNHPSQFLKKKDFSSSLSGKTEMLSEILQSIYENNEKVLIFTQYKEMGDILQTIIEQKFGNKPLFLHGSIPVKKRTEMVERFQTDSSQKTFILSIKAAGTGLNLTQANHVIHYDLWWNPAVEAQATDRAFRIGQQKNVMVYRLISKGTFEEKINEMIQHKKQLADLTVEAGETWIGDLSNKELNDLVGL